jgi:hypothetical protein
MAQGEHNTLSFHIDIERIARANSEPAPQRPGKNDLAFSGNSGLHGKTILPRPDIIMQSRRTNSGAIPRSETFVLHADSQFQPAHTICIAWGQKKVFLYGCVQRTGGLIPF